jgi:hypothetical protein
MAVPPRIQVYDVDATAHGDLFVLAQVNRAPTERRPVTRATSRAPRPVPTRAMREVSHSLNHMLPSTPAAISHGADAGVGTGNSVTAPAISIRPILLPIRCVNHMAPSGPGAMPLGAAPGMGRRKSVTAPEGVIRATLLPLDSVDHMLPSGPRAMLLGPPPPATS